MLESETTQDDEIMEEYESVELIREKLIMMIG